MWGMELMKRVAVISTNENFLQPILTELKKRDTLVEKLAFNPDSWESGFRFQDMMDWADCAFFDFIHRPLPAASYWLNANHSVRITARLHGLEVYDQIMHDVVWQNVNLICSRPQKMRFDMLNLKSQPASINVLNLGVDTKPTEKPKEVFGHNIGINSYTPLPRKRIYTTIETFCELLRRSDAPWTLHVVGTYPPTNWRRDQSVEYGNFISELRYAAAEEGILLSDHLVLHNWLERNAYEAWLAGMDIVISNSMQEGYHKAIFEAMSYGAFPLVHDWLGARTLLPVESRFLTQSELVDKILAWEETPVEKKLSASLQVQKYVREHHDQEKCAKQAVDVILGES